MEANDLKNSKQELEKTPETSGLQEVQSSENDLTNTETQETTEEAVAEVEITESSENTVEEPESAESTVEEPESTKDTVVETENTEDTVVEPESVEEPESTESTEDSVEDPESTEDTVIETENTEPESAEDNSVEDTVTISQDISSEENSISIDEDDPEESKPDNKPEKESKIDYSSFTEVELINRLRELISEDTGKDIKGEVETIKHVFYKKHEEVIEEEKKRFIEEGGKEQNFEPSNKIYEEDIKSLLKDVRSAKGESPKIQEEEKEQNFQKKLEIIEDIKSLVNREESINKTFQEFRDLQQRWRKIGPVPQSRLKDLWDTYHHHVENFYDYIRINKELRDLDLKKNMEAKINLCKKTEELLKETSIIKAFSILQQYHEQWREIGPVPREKKEELWEQFKEVTAALNAKHQEYYEGRREEQKKNLAFKLELCAKAEAIAAIIPNSTKVWEEKSNELIELQRQWREIGYISRKENDKAYKQFRQACDTFFNTRREFFNKSKEVQSKNLQLKTELCEKAEAIKESTDWKKTTDEFVKIQKQWREIGTVPRKYSDTLWKRFRSACDYFFDQKKLTGSSADNDQINNLKLKKSLIEEVNNFQPTDNEEDNLAKLNDFNSRWAEIGFVPFKQKDIIQNEFKKAIDAHYDKMEVDDQTRNILKFQYKISNLSGSDKGYGRMRAERDKYVSRLKQLESDLALQINNIGFFANTKNAESLIDDVNRQIKETQEKIEVLREKIRIIDEKEDEY